ncbi:MAG: DUF1631 family protein [Gammaproteobacteria bacterium]
MDGTDNTQSGRERRRFERLPIHLEALIALGPRPPIACIVKDFCVAGMFLQIDTRQLRFVQPRTPAALHFALKVGGEVKEYKLALEICRVTGSGLGVGFKNPDPASIDLLHGLARAAAPPPPPTTAESDTQKRFVPEFGRVLPELTERVERVFGQIATEFTRGAADSLFLAARDARSNREQTLFVDAQTALRRRTPGVLEQVPALMAKAIAILDNPVRDGVVAPPKASSGLSLVDKEEFEEFLTVSELVAELEGRHKDPLFDLNRRISFLSRREVTDSDNPLGPTVICGVFAESIKGLASDLAVSGVVYQALRKCLDAHLGKLYEDMNAFFVEKNILPVIERGGWKIGDDKRSSTQPGPLESTRDGARTVPPDSMVQALSRTQQSIWQNSQSRAARAAAGLSRTATGLSRTGPQPGGATMPPAFFPALDPHGPPAERGAARGGSGAPAAGGTAAGAVPAGAVSAAAPVPPGMGGGLAPDVTFSGFGFGPAVGNLPSFEQALSIAQHQLALRRDLLPAAARQATVDPRRAFSRAQLLEGLNELQQNLTATLEPDLLNADVVKRHIVDALRERGIETEGVGQAESDVIEIIVNLFQALLGDSRLGEFAKGNLKRLQGAVHKAALADDEFLSATAHPLRQLMNRVAMLELVPGEDGQRLQSRLREILDSFNLAYRQDPSVAETLLPELDGYLKSQHAAFDANVRAIVDSCEEQQRFLRERRERGGDTLPPQPTFPAELQRWVARAKALRVGDRMIMNANTKTAYVATLVWIGDDFNPYVLADSRGHKTASMTLQQVAMYLRRGLIRALGEDGESAVDRALYGVVNRLHEEVAEHAALDELTGLPTRNAFLNAIAPQLPQSVQAETAVVLGQLSIDNLKTFNEQGGTTTGDQLLKRTSEALKSTFDAKVVTLGRLGGNEWGIFWNRGGLQAAHKELSALLDKLKDVRLPTVPDLAPRYLAGIAAVDVELAALDPLVTAVHEATGLARHLPDPAIYVAGADSRQRKQLEQMTSYVAKAVERERLALLFHEVRALGNGALPAARVIVSAEDRNRKLVPPVLFNQAAFHTPHALDLDLWTLRHTLRWMAAHDEECERFSAFVIPLSHAAVGKDDIAHVVVNELMESAVPPARVCFEIEDKVAQSKLVEAGDLINTLREFGCQFILAEFGGAQGNYEYLKELAVNFVSLPSGYVQDARQDPKDLAMVRSINELAHFMGKLTIAKIQGDDATLQLLKDIKVDFVHDTNRATRLLLGNDG